MSLRTRGAYLAVTASTAAAGGAAARALELGSPRAVWLGVAAAWLLQAPSFWYLAGALDRGDPVLRDWVGGMALRLGGLALIGVAGTAAGIRARDAAVAYVAALLAFLALEVVWLLPRAPAAPASGERPADREDRDDDMGRHPGTGRGSVREPG